MSADTPTAGAPADAHHHGPSPVKIWGILLVLLIVSVLGPELKIQWLTLVTAFGIAIVKAYLVVKHFMHLTVEKKFVGYLLITMLALMLIFVGGVSPDVLKHEGQRWENTAAKEWVEKGLKEMGEHGAHH